MPIERPSENSDRNSDKVLPNSVADGIGAKVLREVDLLGAAGSGFADQAAKAMHNPGETTLKIAGAAALGAGLALVTHKPGMIGLAAKSFGIAGGVAFAAEAGAHGADVVRAAQSSWNSDAYQQRNRAVVGQSAGAFLFDTAMMGAAGSAGAIGTRSYFAREAAAKIEIPLLKVGEEASINSSMAISKQDELARLYAGMTGKVGRVETLAQEDGGMVGRFGTAFSVGDGRMVTNHHVVDKALDLTIFDRFGRAHSAEIVKTSPVHDLALIQLKDPKAAARFGEVAVQGSGVIKANVAGEPLFSVGFPNGWQKPFLSPGETINAVRVDPLNMRVKLHAENGNSGGPIIDAQGKLVGVLKQGDRSNHDLTILTPAESVSALVESARMNGRYGVPLPVVNRQHYQIADGQAASANIEKLFPLDKRIDGTSDFFHSKITRVLMPRNSNISELIVRSQYQPASRQIVVEPLALDGKPLSAEMVWPGSNVPIASSKLTLQLDRNQTPVSMEGINDPKMFLRRAFDYKSAGNYLAGLEGSSKPSLKAQVRQSAHQVMEWLSSSVHT